MNPMQGRIFEWYLFHSAGTNFRIGSHNTSGEPALREKASRIKINFHEKCGLIPCIRYQPHELDAMDGADLVVFRGITADAH